MELLKYKTATDLVSKLPMTKPSSQWPMSTGESMASTTADGHVIADDPLENGQCQWPCQTAVSLRVLSINLLYKPFFLLLYGQIKSKPYFDMENVQEVQFIHTFKYQAFFSVES